MQLKHTTDAAYWDNRWQTNQTGWDIGNASTPLAGYADHHTNKNSRLLLPGCGNAWEAVYLLRNGFTNITLLDISPTLVASLSKKLSPYVGKGTQIICDDFFTHSGTYDIILEQTFFCALHPALRPAYAAHMHYLLAEKGKLAGVLFNRHFDENPPFGGTENEYRLLFEPIFAIQKMELCTNSIPARQGNELFFVLEKKA